MNLFAQRTEKKCLTDVNGMESSTLPYSVFFLFTPIHISAVYWSESRWQSPWLEDLEDI